MKKTNQSKRTTKTNKWDKSLQPYTIQFIEPHNTKSEIKNVVWAKNRNEAFILASDLYPTALHIMILRKGITSHYKSISIDKRITKVSKRQKALADKLC